MWAALSTLSSFGLWILVDPSTQTLVGYRSWKDTNNSGHSSRLHCELVELCHQSKIDLSDISTLYGACGPGAFTGLRMCSSFLKGLSFALSCPLYPIPTFSLFDREVFLPLRHLKAIQMSKAEYLQAGFEFLKISAPYQGEIAIPRDQDTVLFFDDQEIWPSPEGLLKGILWAHKNPKVFEVDYGLDVKISGIRTAL